MPIMCQATLKKRQCSARHNKDIAGILDEGQCPAKPGRNTGAAYKAVALPLSYVGVGPIRPYPLLWAVVKLSHPEICVVGDGACSSLA